MHATAEFLLFGVDQDGKCVLHVRDGEKNGMVKRMGGEGNFFFFLRKKKNQMSCFGLTRMASVGVGDDKKNRRRKGENEISKVEDWVEGKK